MTKESQDHIIIESEYDEFDPLEDTGADEEFEEAEDSVMAQLGQEPEEETVPAKPLKPAPERIADLFASMAPRRKTLLGILAFCEEPVAVEDVNAHIDELQLHNASVYSPASLCELLKDAGALELITAEGECADGLESEPVVVEVDGVEYLEPGEPLELFWHTTPEGMDAVDQDNPLERTKALLDEDVKYATIYKRILELADTQDGVTIKAINAVVDDDPLVKKPRLYAPHFVDKLEKSDAIEWSGAWKTTEIGREALQLLSDVIDEYGDGLKAAAAAAALEAAETAEATETESEAEAPAEA